VPVALCILPVVALGSYAVAALIPSLAIMRWVKTAENSVDYSLMNTVRQMLFLPTTRGEKYKAKQVIDSFVVRIGDVLSAGTVYLGTTFFALTVSQFAWVNVVLVLVWLALAVATGLEFQRRASAQ
jgi:AAA family ATP:ADP antiporter